MNIEFAGLAAAFLAGLLGSTHCFGMCGGISSALQLAIPKKAGATFIYLLNYNLGRILGYTILGGVVGIISVSTIKTFAPKSALDILRILGAIFLVLMAGYIGRWWMLLTKFEQLGQTFFNPLKRFGKKWLPLKRPSHAIILGTIWGFLPCGLVYSALAYSAAASSIPEAALRMTFFGLGTLPAVGLMGSSASRIKIYLQQNRVKQIAATSMLVIALWTVLPVLNN